MVSAIRLLSFLGIASAAEVDILHGSTQVAEVIVIVVLLRVKSGVSELCLNLLPRHAELPLSMRVERMAEHFPVRVINPGSLSQGLELIKRSIAWASTYPRLEVGIREHP